MRAEEVLARSSRRLWRGWVPAITVLVLLQLMVCGTQSGLPVLLIIVAGGLAFGALVDLVSAERLAYRLDREEVDALVR